MIKEPQNESEQVRVRLGKLAKLVEQSENPYKNGYTPKFQAKALHVQYAETSKEELATLNTQGSVAGRLMTKRLMGKAAFATIKDSTGLFQLFISQDKLGPEAYERFKELDIGDIIFGEGHVFRTKTGELSLGCERVVLLTKSLHPLPEKFHGISDIEIKYRQRYLDLITSDESRDTFRKRSMIVQEVRSFMVDRGFMEVETPMMHPIAGGATARPFMTHHNTLDMDLFMRIAPELYLKRLVVGGFERVFEINRNFRNEGMSIKHNPEFTMMEFYQAYATYEDLMVLTQELFQSLADKVLGKRTLNYQGTEIQLDGNWHRISVEDSIIQMSGFKDRAKIRDKGALLAYGKAHGLHMDEKDSTGGLQMVIFDHEVEAKLIQPTFVTLYPLDVSPLSRKNERDPFP